MTYNQVLIYDFNRNQVYFSKFESDEFTINDIDLQAGNYIVNFPTHSGGVS